MGAWAGVLFVALFSAVNYFLWGGGYDVHLLGIPVDGYTLIWFWIALIAITYGSNYAVDGHGTHQTPHVIGFWWTANISMTTILNMFNTRGVEEIGNSFLGLPGIILDFTAQGAVDLASLFIVWSLIKHGKIEASIWILIFCGYLVGNLFGHATGAYNLMIGADFDQTAQAYDSYMYLIFTVMLILQAIGSSGDALLRWSGSNVNLYVDIRPYLSRFISRYIHLH